MLFWKEAAACLQNNLQFVDRVTKRAKSIPSLRNWIRTLNGFQNLWQILQEKGFKEFFPGHVNQPSIENFFRMVRSHGRRNINPTCRQFEASFKSLLINSLTSAKTVKGNCKSDNCEVLFSLRDFALSAHNIAVEENEKVENEQYMLFNDTECDNTDTSLDNSKILKKIIQKIKHKACCVCISSIANFPNIDNFMKEAYYILQENIPFFCYKKHLINNLKLPLPLLIDYSFITCEIHREQLINELITAVSIEYVICWCRHINMLLKGKDSGERATSYLSKEAILQYKKKLRIRFR